MLIRFGYVAIALKLDNATPNKTVTYKQLSKLPDDETRLYKLKRITRDNLETTKRILLYNLYHDIILYRFTSKLVPLATHPEVVKWDYIEEFQNLYQSIGEIVIQNGLRVSAHPDHFTVINTPKEEVFQASIQDLDYHIKIFEAMNLSHQEAKLILHVGGIYGNKELAAMQFVDNVTKLDNRYRSRIVLENDDKAFTAKDVLEICKSLSIPMVVDIHHHWCNNNGEKIEDLIEDIFDTWKNELHPPKIHVSSPRDCKNVRAHADYVNFKFFMDFIDKVKKYDFDFDVMIEAKKKDLALFDLMDHFRRIHHIEMVNGASVKI